MNDEQLLKVKSIAMDSANNGITISDAQNDNRLVYVNDGFSRLTGYSAAEIIGENCRFLQYPESGQAAVARLGEAIEGRAFIKEEIVNYKKDGTRFINRLSVTPVFDDGGTLTHYIGIQEDITMEKKMLEVMRQLADQKLIIETTRLAEDKERRLLGEELHDNVNQLLAVTKLYLKMAGDDEKRRMEMIGESETMLMRAMEEIRKLSRRLTGPDENDELAISLADLVQSVQQGVPFSLMLRTDPAAEIVLTPGRKLTIYRVVQEQLNNILKYAGPQNVDIILSRTDGAVVLSVKDDGAGFDTAAFAEGIGLKNMRHRAEAQKGELEVISSPGAGCEIRVLFSLLDQ